LVCDDAICERVIQRVERVRLVVAKRVAVVEDPPMVV
jgi:hypothetical protein